MKVCVLRHQGASPGTGKKVEGTLSTSVRDHMLNCNHKAVWEDFSVIGRGSNGYLLGKKKAFSLKL